MMDLFHSLAASIKEHASNPAFFINGSYATYSEFGAAISAIRKRIIETVPASEKIVAVAAHDDVETYAAIVALWLEGKAYVPLNPETPYERNAGIVEQSGIRTLLDSEGSLSFGSVAVIKTKELDMVETSLTPCEIAGEANAYLLFTSGSTGVPKGVPVTRNNVASFIDAFNALGYTISEKDRFLQMFDLTFDLSVMSYLIPMLHGACIYTIPKDRIKFNYIAELFEEQQLTFALMVPSIIHYLRPYFSEVVAESMRYCLFCGEALHTDVTREWSACLPNAKIVNVYGPTENTIFCTAYDFDKQGNNKEKNGILSIGAPMKNTGIIITGEQNKVLGEGEIGELCLSGGQLTPGYWNNAIKNSESFFDHHEGQAVVRYYRTGDLCSCDAEGAILFHGRKDSQAKIQGFRVELSEVEYHVKTFLEKINAVAVTFTNKIGNTEIGLIIESGTFDTAPLATYLKTKMPQYMIPSRWHFTKSFPLNANGKIDKKQLTQLLINEPA